MITYILIDARLRCYLFVYFIAVILNCAVSGGEVWKGIGNEVGRSGVRALGEIGKLRKFREDFRFQTSHQLVKI